MNENYITIPLYTDIYIMSHRCSIYMSLYSALYCRARARESSGYFAAMFEFPMTVLLKIYFLQ